MMDRIEHNYNQDLERSESTSDLQHHQPQGGEGSYGMSTLEVIFGLMFVAMAIVAAIDFCEWKRSVRESELRYVTERQLQSADRIHHPPLASQGGR
jgi:hypothetical protein